MNIETSTSTVMKHDAKPLSEASETNLVERAQKRDQEAFAELMRRNASTSLRLAVSVLKDRQEAEDQVQTSFFKAWTKLPEFEGQAKFSTWFRRIVLNQSLMQLRKRKRAPTRSLDEPSEDGRTMEVPAGEPTAEAELGDEQMAAVLRQEVQMLPPLLRDVLILKDLEQLSVQEAADRLGISEPAAKSRLLRAREALRERMERHQIARRRSE